MVTKFLKEWLAFMLSIELFGILWAHLNHLKVTDSKSLLLDHVNNPADTHIGIRLDNSQSPTSQTNILSSLHFELASSEIIRIIDNLELTGVDGDGRPNEDILNGDGSVLPTLEEDLPVFDVELIGNCIRTISIVLSLR